MSIINYCVYCTTKKSLILPWKITPVHPPSLTYSAFFHSDVAKQCPQESMLSNVYVGKSKDALDLVDGSLVVLEVGPLFGQFVKFAVEASAQIELELEVLILNIAMYYMYVRT